MGISESLVMSVIFCSISVRFLIMAFAEYTWLYYLGKHIYIRLITDLLLWIDLYFSGGLVDLIGPYAFAIVKAMATTCCSSFELGKINAFLSAIESLLPSAVAQIYASVWKVIDIWFLIFYSL